MITTTTTTSLQFYSVIYVAQLCDACYQFTASVAVAMSFILSFKLSLELLFSRNLFSIGSPLPLCFVAPIPIVFLRTPR